MSTEPNLWLLSNRVPSGLANSPRIDDIALLRPPGIGPSVADLPFPDPVSDHQRIANAVWLLKNNPTGQALLPADAEDATNAPRFAAVAPGTSDGTVADRIVEQLERGDGAPVKIAQRPASRTSNTSSVRQPAPKFENFFNQHFEPVLKEAAKFGVDPALMLGLAAHESNWGTSNQATNMNNPFGHTPNGKNPTPFPSLQAAWQVWGTTHGPRIKDTGSDAEEFVDRLLQDNRNVYGPTIGGDRLGAYNDPKFGDRNWKPKVLGVIQSVRNRLPRWQGERNMIPRREE